MGLIRGADRALGTAIIIVLLPHTGAELPRIVNHLRKRVSSREVQSARHALLAVDLERVIVRRAVGGIGLSDAPELRKRSQCLRHTGPRAPQLAKTRERLAQTRGLRLCGIDAR